MGDERDEFFCARPDRHWAGVALDNRDIEYLFDRAIDAEPFGASSLGQIDNLDTAPWLAVGVEQPLIERQPFKTLVAWLGQPNKSKAVLDRQPAGKAWTKDPWHKFALASRGALDNAQFTRPGIEQP